MSKIVKLAILVCVLCAVQVGRAAYTIDGSLSDWGVTPFSDWVPDSATSYEEVRVGDYYGIGDHGFSYMYDQEAMYFDYDADNLYFAIVSSYEHTGDNSDSGDLALKIGGSPMVIDLHGQVQTAVIDNSTGIATTEGLEYAVRMGSDPYRQVVRTDTWLQTNLAAAWEDNGVKQGSPWKADNAQAGNTNQYFEVLGNASVAVTPYDLDPADSRTPHDTWIVEVAIPRSFFPAGLLTDGTYIGAHFTMFCGNDVINLHAYLGDDDDDDDDVIPAPGAVVLASIGSALVGWIRRRRLA